MGLISIVGAKLECPNGKNSECMAPTVCVTTKYSIGVEKKYCDDPYKCINDYTDVDKQLN